jgi:rRNA maturation protein Nop10
MVVLITRRLACTHCGTHLSVPADAHYPGGQCSVCGRYELVAVPREGSSYR